LSIVVEVLSFLSQSSLHLYPFLVREISDYEVII